MSRAATTDGTRGRSRPSPGQPPWPSVAVEPIAPPNDRRRAWGSISYEQRYLEQREAFLRITRELANTSSPDEVQISHIVAAAGVSRRTFYEHFATKEACFAEIVRRSARPFVERFVRAAEPALPLGPTETFRALITSWAELISGDNPTFSRQLALRMWTDGLRPDSPYAEALSRIVDVVTDVFVVAAQRLGTPLEDRILHVAARQQVLGLIGSILHLVDHTFSAVEHERLANVIAGGLGFATPPSTQAVTGLRTPRRPGPRAR